MLATAGCHPQVRSAEPLPLVAAPLVPPAPAAVTNEFLVRETQLLDGALTIHLDIPLSPSGPKPVVINLFGDSRPLLAAGFVAATYSINWALLKDALPPPAPAEGGVGKWVLASPSASVLGERYLREIGLTATRYVPMVIDYLATVPEIDATRIGMLGGSTNGFITLAAAAHDRRIDAAVVVAACGDYRLFLRDSSMGMAGAPLALSPAYERWVKSQEVIRTPSDLVHVALLMVNRSGDQLIPVACADETARILSAAFARAGVADRFRYVRLPDAGHGYGPQEAAEAMAWLVRWLKPK